MKNLLILIALFFTTFSFSQNIEKDLYLKHSLRQDGESYQFLVLADDKRGVFHHDKSKYYFWFKAQKVMSTQGGSSGLLLNGKFESFYDNKQLSRKGKFHKGLKDGEWLYWRQDGSLIHVEHWKRGRLSGEEMYFDEKGKVTITTDYGYKSFSRKTNDSLIVSNYSGTKKTVSLFDEKGVVTSTKSFKNGKQVEEKEKKKIKLFSIFKKKDEAVKENKTSETKSTSKKNDQPTEVKKDKKKWFKFLKKDKKGESNSK